MPRIPAALRGVAGLFIFTGVMALLDIGLALAERRLSLNFGVLGLLIGPGLLRLSRTSWVWALVFTWVVMIGSGLALGAVLLAPGRVEFRLFGLTVGEGSRLMAAGLGVIIFLLVLWQYWVLTRPDVRQLFRRDAPPPVTPSGE